MVFRGQRACAQRSSTSSSPSWSSCSLPRLFTCPPIYPLTPSTPTMPPTNAPPLSPSALSSHLSPCSSVSFRPGGHPRLCQGQMCLWWLRGLFQASWQSPQNSSNRGDRLGQPRFSQDALGAWEPGGREEAQLRSSGLNSMHH